MISKKKKCSSQLMLRIDSELHANLRKQAEEACKSINEYCRESLILPISATTRLYGGVLANLVSAFKENIEGLILYCSAVRGELFHDSDIDILVVLNNQEKISRKTYQRVEPQMIQIENRWHEIEINFVHLPLDEKFDFGLWAEIATEGIVIWENGIGLSGFLAKIRRNISAGVFLRKEVQGQPYWIDRRSENA